MVPAVFLALVTATMLIAQPARASFPGANGRIVFQSSRDGNPEIYSMNRDGSSQVRLTNNAAIDAGPVVSPDGTRIAFSSNRELGNQIWVMDVDGSDQTRITEGCGALFPAWSPDGTKIAFTEFCFDDIYVVNLDGTGMTGLATSSDFERFPAWSPDGTKIAYSRYNGTEDDIWVMNADGSNQVDLTNNSASELHPDWAPDGSRIAYARAESTGYDIFVMDVDGSNPTNLTSSAGDEIWPVWAPDGSRIAFVVDGGSVTDIWTMAGDGSARTNLTAASDAIDNTPDWQPVGADAADLAVSVSDQPDPVAPGSDVTYDVTLDNAGPGSADVSLSGTLPAGTSFTSLASPAGWVCSTPAVGGTGTVGCTKPSVAAGTGAAFTLVVNVDEGAQAGTRISYTVTAHATPFDPDPADDVATATTTVGVSPDQCTIVGTAEPEELTGTPGDDIICGGDGMDTIDGEGGNDIILGGKGADVLNGDEGNDTIVGWNGRDEITGGTGLDVMIGGAGRDVLDGQDEAGGDVLDGGRREDECLTDTGDLTASCP